MAPYFISRSNHAGPNRSCGALRNRLPLKGSLTLNRKLLIHLVNHRLQAAAIHMSPQLRLYASRMHRGSPHPALPMPPIESNREQNVRRFRPPVSNERIVRRPLKANILKVDVGEAMTR